MRLDVFLVEKKLANSRTQAQNFIAKGFVTVLANDKKQVINKPSYEVKEFDQVEVVQNEFQKFVSRAGLKLEAALHKVNLKVVGMNVLDVGQSTGGFTDCLLQQGAAQVVGIDVGHGQLHDSLKNNSKVISFENLNVKDLSINASFIKSIPNSNFDLVVADVSFISLTKVIPSIANFLPQGKEYLFLVKPQFECGREKLDKNGIVIDNKTFNEVESKIKECALVHFKNVEAYFESGLLGKDGNQEYFIYGKKSN